MSTVPFLTGLSAPTPLILKDISCFSHWTTGILVQKINAVIKKTEKAAQRVLSDLEGRVGTAECCGGNTQGSDTSCSGTDPLNSFIERFCSLQLTGHTTPQHVSLQEPWNAWYQDI